MRVEASTAAQPERGGWSLHLLEGGFGLLGNGAARTEGERQRAGQRFLDVRTQRGDRASQHPRRLLFARRRRESSPVRGPRAA